MILMESAGGKNEMKMTNDEYKKYTEEHSPHSKSGQNLIRAFLVGGTICLLGQGITDGLTALGVEKAAASAGCSISLIFLGALLTGLGIYDDIAEFAGAGTLVPITGFANSVVAPALEFKTEGFILGVAAKMFIISGPVIVYGISSSFIYGLLLILFGA